MKKKMIEPEYPMVIETFRDVGFWELNNLTQHKPGSLNGQVRVRKYRVTVELIEEPLEVIQERISKLWNECVNFHNKPAIQEVGKKYGLELKY